MILRPPDPPCTDPWPFPDQDADLVMELDAILPGLEEPSDEELAGLDLSAGGPADSQDWLAGPDGARGDAARGQGAGFGDGEALDVLGPGPTLAGFAQAVVDDGLGALSDDELIGVLRASRRLTSWQDGVGLAAVAELASRRQSGRPVSSLVDQQVSGELAAALVLTGRSADALLGLARDLARLPAVGRALLAGVIDLARARIFAEEVAGLGDVAAAAVAAGFASIAGTMTTGQLRSALKSMVLFLDPAAARKRAETGKAQARVEAWQENSGNMGLAGQELPVGDAIAADKRLTAIAQALKDAGALGTLDQLRAAAFVALLAGRDPGTLLPSFPDGGNADNPGQPGRLPRPGDPAHARTDGNPASSRLPSEAGPAGSGAAVPASSGPGWLGALTGTVHLVMPAAAWLGLSDAPGEVPGLGPLNAWTCRDLAARLAAGGTRTRWQVTLTSRDGRAVAHAAARAGPGPPLPAADAPQCGPDSCRAWLAGLQFDWLERGTCSHARQIRGYQPGNRLRNLICARQRTCSFPGCRRPAVRCDLDHTRPYDQGGRTCECNLSPLCRRHHHVKQAAGWTLTQPEPGVLVWTAPHGRSYTVTPDPYPV